MSQIGLCFLCLFACSVSAQTVAYWRFESDDVERPITRVEDLSGNGNHLLSFSEQTAPRFSREVAFDVVPQTGDSNHSCLDNTAAPGRGLPTRDLFLAHEGEGFDLSRDQLSVWTIEVSVCFKPVENWTRRWQTMVVREGYNIPERDALQEDQLPCLSFKKRGDNNHFSIEAFDSAKTLVVVQSRDEVQENVWYHVAVMSDGKKLSLFVKAPDDAEFVKHGDADFQGALFNTGGGWCVARGFFGNGPTEQCFGLIDEVRISSNALSPAQFLATKADPPVAVKPVRIPSDPSTRAPLPEKFPEAPPGLIYPHDPTTILAGEWYHVFSTEGGLHHWRSKDLVQWEELPRVFDKTPQWAFDEISQRPGLWAPDVLFFNGKFHLYYSVSTFGHQKSAIALVTNASLNPDDPNFKWEDHGPVVQSRPGDPFNCIDPTIFFDADNKPWLAWGSYWRGIYLAPVDPLTGKPSIEKKDFIHLAERKGNTAIEAPHIFYLNGWYYLIVANDACCRGANSTYKLMVGRSKKIEGPYLDRDNEPMLEGHASLLLRGYSFYRGPGHSSLVKKGDELILTHHYYDARANGRPTLAARPLYFDDAGWPLVGEPIDTLQETLASSDLKGTWTVYEDYGKALVFEFRSDGTLRGSPGEGKWKLEDRTLTLEWMPLGREGKQVVDRCFVAKDLRSFVGRRSDGTIVSGVRK
jgi:arabinan endo-1,5-alpha-L-arabinosidase